MTLLLVDDLLEDLNSSGIAYCHWKSNFNLAEAMAGELDLDLLVERKSLPQTLAILMSLGFKLAAEKGKPTQSGIYHYYGIDPQTAQLIHVHLFSRVLTGESFVKSHLLPYQSMLLEDTDYIGQMRVPASSAELVLFIVRTFIKYGSLLDLIYLYRSSDEIRAEMRWLLADSDMPQVLCLLERNSPEISDFLFINCIDILNSNASLADRIIMARQVRRRLRKYAINGRVGCLLAYGRTLWREAWRRLLRTKRNRILDSGGVMIAFIGAEATGKSTLVSSCECWLSDVFAVRAVHAGKPPSSPLTFPINLFLPLGRRIFPHLRSTRLKEYRSSKGSSKPMGSTKGISSLIVALGAIVLAWDRRRLLVNASRLAANGEIIICDRYPSDIVGAMDSPRLKDIPQENKSIATIHNWLVRIERHLYEQVPTPDLVLMLEVSVETAIKRNRERNKAGKETDQYIAYRHRQFKQWYKSGTKYVYRIDTAQSLDQTIREVRKAIWEVL